MPLQVRDKRYIILFFMFQGSSYRYTQKCSSTTVKRTGQRCRNPASCSWADSSTPWLWPVLQQVVPYWTLNTEQRGDAEEERRGSSCLLESQARWSRPMAAAISSAWPAVLAPCTMAPCWDYGYASIQVSRARYHVENCKQICTIAMKEQLNPGSLNCTPLWWTAVAEHWGPVWTKESKTQE